MGMAGPDWLQGCKGGWWWLEGHLNLPWPGLGEWTGWGLNR